MNGAVSWKVFAYKFDNREQAAFEELAYQIFCKKFHLREGLSRFYNQHYIETNPARISDSRIIGFQAKYFENKVINGHQIRVLKNVIENSARKYPEMTELFFFLNSEFSESTKEDETRTKEQLDLEACAERHGLEVHWFMPGNFEITLQQEEYRGIWEHYFHTGNSGNTAVSDYSRYIKDLYCSEKSNCIYGNESLQDAYIPPHVRTGSKARMPLKEYLEDFVRGQERVAVIYGEPGHGKTSMCIKSAYDFYSEQWLQDSLSNIFLFSLNPSGTKAIDYVHRTFSFEKLLSFGNDRANESNIIKPEECGHALIFLDAFDELIENIRSSTNGYFDNMEEFIDGYVNDFASEHDAHVVITSRKLCIQSEFHESGGNEVSIAGVPCIELGLMNHDDQDRWLHTYLIRLQERNGSVAQETLRFIDNFKKRRTNRALLKLTGVPILFRMIVYNQLDERFTNSVDLYDKLFKSMLVRQNKKSKINHFSARLEELAKNIYEGNDDSTQVDESLMTDEESRCLDEWTYSFFIENRAKRQIAFFHRSFYQYFLADYLYKLLINCKNEESATRLLVFLTRRKIDYTTFQFLYERVRLKKTDLHDTIQSITDLMIKTDAIIAPAFDAKWCGEVSRLWLTKNLVWNMTGIISAVCSSFRYSQEYCYLLTSYSCSGLLVSSRNISNIEVDFSNRRLNGGQFFLSYFDSVRADHAECYSANFSKARMRKADFRHAQMVNADFGYATMIDINLENADLSNAILVGARLRNANLSHADLKDAILYGASLRFANLTDASLKDTDLKKINLDHAVLNGTILDRSRLKGALLTGTTLRNMELTNVDFSEADLRKITIEDSKFSSVDFTKCDMREITIRRSVFENCIFDHADCRGSVLEDVKFRNVSMKAARFNRTPMTNVDFNIGDLSRAVFKIAAFKNCRFHLTNHGQEIFREIEFTDTEFSNAAFHETTILLCTGKNLTFKNCNLSTASLIKNTIDSTIIDVCDVKGTIFINIEKDHVHFVETNPDGIVTVTE